MLPDPGKSTILDMIPINQELLSPKDFLGRLPEIENEIVSAMPVAPILGQPGFGRIRVIYRRPIYKFLTKFISNQERVTHA